MQWQMDHVVDLYFSVSACGINGSHFAQLMNIHVCISCDPSRSTNNFDATAGLVAAS